MDSSGPRLTDEQAQRTRRRAVIAMLVATIIWGWAFVWMKDGVGAGDQWLEHYAPDARSGWRAETSGLWTTIGVFTVLRFGAAAIVLALLSRKARSGLDAAAWRGGLLLGGLLVIGFFLQMSGLHSVSPSVSAFLTSLYVVFTAAIAAALARKAPAPQMMLGALLATVGAAYIAGPPQIAFGVGEWLTVLGAFVFAVHIVCTDRVTKRVEPMAVTLTSFIVVALGSLAITAVGFASSDTPALADLGRLLEDRQFLISCSCASFFATLIAISAMNVFQRELDPVRAAIIYAIEPVWAAVISIALGSDEPSGWLYFGGAAMLAGNLVAELRRGGASPSP